KMVCRTKEERTFFRFATNMMKKERDFKLRVYPSLGFSMIFPFIFILSGIKGEGFEGLRFTKTYFSLYFIALMIPTILMTIGYSGNYKGAWVYKIAPFNETRTIFKGTTKAFLVNLILPIYIFGSIISIIVFRGEVIIDLIAMFLNILLFTVI